MVLELIVATLIVYGLTLLVVQGTIFNNLKESLSNKIKKLYTILQPSDEDVLGLIEASHVSISKKVLSIYKELSDKVATVDFSHKNFETYTKMLEDAREAAKRSVYSYRNKYYFTRFKLMAAELIKKLTSCMMCMGFWNGIFICLITAFCHINICTMQLNIIKTTEPIQFITTCFLMGCFFSGTTWVIHTIIDTIDEIKEFFIRHD